MMTRSAWATLALTLIIAAVFVIGVVCKPEAAGSEQEQPRRMAQVGAAQSIAAAVVGVPRDDDEIDELLSAVQVDDPVSYKGLTLFPVSLRREYSDFLPYTFDEAVDRSYLRVEEVGGGSVNSVRVRNNGRRPVFIMAGEIMSGSKQDRTAQRDVLIPRHSGWVTIPVYCVEAGRWTMVSPQFGTKRALANPSLRSMAYGGAAQDSIWREVDSAAKAQGVRQSGAKAFQEIYESSEVKDRLREYRSGLRLPRGRRLVGFVAFSRSRAIGADLFGNTEVFDELREKLVDSYILAIGRGERVPTVLPSAREAARFLACAWSDDCSRRRTSTPGIGDSYRLRNARYDTAGGALIYQNEVVHMSLFPEAGVRPVPVPVPIPGPEPIPIPRLQRGE